MPNDKRQDGQRRQSEASGNASVENQGQGSMPTISLPKGGGAIRGIGEKFAANPVTGTGSMTVPIAVTPGRSGFSPQLTLSYDSGSGNGPFGLGWNLSLPTITRKTDKGLPRYQDGDESDVFILSGAEDLVPALVREGNNWRRDSSNRTVDNVAYEIQRYRPRVEGLFARIERWKNIKTGETHWRSISKDNITTLYGKTSESRIADPDDSGRVFSWLICESRDDKGNAIIYEYAGEDSRRIDPVQVNELNRTNQGRTANRYPKRVKYGNRTSHLIQPDLSQTDWLFEVLFDFDEGHYEMLALDERARQFVQARIEGTDNWAVRSDPFSTFRAGFEVRTYRLCRRVLMFHHFPEELGVDDYLVRSTEFNYHETPIASFINLVTQSGYVRQSDGSYLKKSLPPLEFEYSDAVIQSEIHEVDTASLENLPYGPDGARYQWADLDGEGISGVLTEQASRWFYKPNLGGGHFGAMQIVALRPSIANLATGQQLIDLAGDGQLDLVQFSPPLSGFYERTFEGGWSDFKPFLTMPNIDWHDPNLKFVDLTGDGHADILISEEKVFTWYASLAEEGFAPAERTRQSFDEEKGPRLVFADVTQSIFVADLSGDGLSDLVRIRNGEVSYWPNLGYGRFGAKVTMDRAPWFDAPDQFDQRRIRLADIDGSGVTDIIYLRRNGIDLYFNQSGNSWSEVRRLEVFPNVDNLSSITVTDLLGNGTACLVWSSPLPGHARQPMRYVELMKQKPHLLTTTKNNMGAETRVQYAASTKFYLDDKAAGTPWVTRLSFPAHVIERVETLDRISRNRFVTRYAYHHGYFDGIEREFRGFGMVEQLDTEEFAALSASDSLPDAPNIDAASHVPPVLTKTWFHTGAYFERGRISKQFAHEYYHEGVPSLGEGALSDAQLEAMLPPDTVLPDGLSIEEEREACRALKGSILRQEVYARDRTADEDRPYSVSERNYTIKLLQPLGESRHPVFLTHQRETIDYRYERKLYDIGGQKRSDPRVTHDAILEVDDYGNELKAAAIGYGRRFDDPDPALTDADRAKQKQMLATLTENRYTNAVQEPDDYRAPLVCEASTFELLRIVPAANHPGITNLFRFQELSDKVATASDGQHDLPYEDVQATGANANHPYRRIIEHVRTIYRRNDLTAPLPLGQLQSRALPFESYKLGLTPSLVHRVYGDRVTEAMLADEGGYVHSEGDTDWWVPSGRVFFSSNPTDRSSSELTRAIQHFLLPLRFVDPFGNATITTFDTRDLLLTETRDAVGNTTRSKNDYRVMQPRLVIDPNGNRSEVAFDAMGLVVGTAGMGKESENFGDSLLGFEPDLDLATIKVHQENPLANPRDVLASASSRLVYDLDRYHRTSTSADPEPNFVYTLARETHASDLFSGELPKIQHSFSYFDGSGREVQKKSQAEPGASTEGGPIVSPRWFGSGWTIFNNKGKPVRKYEPFFSATNQFEFAKTVGVSPILFYDPAERAIATLHPNHTYEKMVFDSWRQITHDVNDTVAPSGTETGDPRTDPDIQRYLAEYTKSLPNTWATWYQQRITGIEGPDEKNSAGKAAKHANTPTITYFDPLGRPFLTLAHNGFATDGKPIQLPTRIEWDIEGNQREVRDPIEQIGDTLGRIVVRYDYDMLGNRVHQVSMEAGERWMLNEVSGKPIRGWDSRGHGFRTEYDSLRRLLRSFVAGAIADHPNQELLIERLVYGEQHPEAESTNLRGQPYLHLDETGVTTNEAHDFKGNLLRASRRFAREYRQALDWTTIDSILPISATTKLNPVTLESAFAPLVEAERFISSTLYDAVNRPIQVVSPHSSLPGAMRNIIQNVYNEANLLEQIHVWLAHPTEPTRSLDPATVPPSEIGVNNIDYDAKGQRVRIDYKNGSTTRYAYDPFSFRLIHLYSNRGTTFTEDCENLQPPPPMTAAPNSPPTDVRCGLQNLRYTYDPAGNITHIRDDAQQTIFFRNKRVEPAADFTYDALYRLVEATGREHLGQVGGTPIAHSHDDQPRVNIDWSANDGNAMGTYRERYQYDAAGNLLSLKHVGEDPANPGWSRSWTYNESSLLEPAKQNNRLSATSIESNNPLIERYTHDAHGNLVRMPHLGGSHPDPNLKWNHKDQLVQAELGGSGTVYYVYDAAGQRTRKVWEKSPGLIEERIYLGGFERFRRNAVGSVTLEREVLHVMDNKQRIVLIETRTQGDEPGLQAQFTRYQFGNHIGSASVELDDHSQIISYEEYTPYGSTSYQAVRSQTEIPKRHRYMSKERDEETGLNYHGARYYAPWLGRWIAVDPVLVSLSQNSAMDRESSAPRSAKTDSLQSHVLNAAPADHERNPGDRSDTAGWVTTQRYPTQSGQELDAYVFTLSNPVVNTDPDGKAPVKIGTIYTVRANVNGQSVVYTGQTARELADRLLKDKHKWADLIRADTTTIEAHTVTAELDVAASSRQSLASARKEALSAAEQVVLKRRRGEAGLNELNSIDAAEEANILKFADRHSVRLGARFTFKSGLKIGAFAGFQLLDIFLMYRDAKLAQYVMAPYLLEDEQGVYTISEEDRGIFRSNRYFKNYKTGARAGQEEEISKDEFRGLKEEAELLWGTTNWRGEWVPGLLRRELPVVDYCTANPNQCA